MKSLFHLIILLLFCKVTFCQHRNYSFEITQQSHVILVNIYVFKGNWYEGIQIFRSANGDTEMDKIGSIYGTCGDSAEDITYHFTDNSPIPNSFNYYSIKLGATEHSEPKNIFFASYNYAGFSIFNDDNQSTLFLKIEHVVKPMKFLLLDISGKNILQINNIQDNQISFDTNEFHHGFYYFIVSTGDDEQITQGKLFIP